MWEDQLMDGYIKRDDIGRLIDVEVDGIPGDVTRDNIDSPLVGYWNPGGEMNVSTMDPDFYERQAALFMRRAEILRSVPKSDVFGNGAVLTFTKVIGGELYSYAAIKANENWFVSGERAPNRIVWANLIDFVGISNLPTIKVWNEQATVSLAEFYQGVTNVLEAQVKVDDDDK